MKKNRSAIAATLYAIEHHAEALKEPALYMFSMAGALGWRYHSARGGNNSWNFVRDRDGAKLKVRGRRHPWRLEFTFGGRTVKLTTRAQVVRWFEAHS